MTSKKLLSCIIFFIVFIAKTNAQAVNETDSLALVDLYNSTNGASWFSHTNWLTGPVSSWYGVGVVGSRVLSLDMPSNNLNGTIPASIGNLDSLTEIDLSSNHLHGIIPASIGNLSALVSLQLYANKLGGGLPTTIAKLRKIRNLDVGYNLLTENKNDSFYFPGGHPFRLDLVWNKFTFNGLESIARSFPSAYYSKQLYIAVHQHNDTLAVSAGGTLSNNTYKWFKYNVAGNTTIVGDSTFVPSESGLYYVRVTNAIATELTLNSDTFNFVMPELRSLASANSTALNKNGTVGIYPNPVKDLLTIKGLNAGSNQQLIIYNAKGDVVARTSANNVAVYNWNVSSLNKGAFYLTVTDSQRTATIKFIRQ